MGQEGLDACLMGSAFADCSLLFLGDGIYQILKGQDPKELGLKDYSVSYGALPDYGVTQFYCRQSDLQFRGLQIDDLSLAAQALTDEEISSLIHRSAQVLTF
ncbi:MAG: tRNA 2-thiouridine synthesizing protein C [Patiriisocius sp.]|jgi:tRNA 2-thiouridine synthesizing protein C